jgi:hypothetical protein
LQAGKWWWGVVVVGGHIDRAEALYRLQRDLEWARSCDRTIVYAYVGCQIVKRVGAWHELSLTVQHWWSAVLLHVATAAGGCNRPILAAVASCLLAHLISGGAAWQFSMSMLLKGGSCRTNPASAQACYEVTQLCRWHRPTAKQLLWAMPTDPFFISGSGCRPAGK